MAFEALAWGSTTMGSMAHGRAKAAFYGEHSVLNELVC